MIVPQHKAATDNPGARSLKNYRRKLGCSPHFGFDPLTGDGRRILLCLMLIVPLIVVAALFGAADVSADSPLIHVVGWGDTLFSIASRYGSTVNAVMQANNLSDPDVIWVGQRLIVPGNGGPGSLPSTSYSVQSGDTLFSIATRYGTTVNDLMQANGLYNYWIYVGQSLRIPGQGASLIPLQQPILRSQRQPQGAYYVVHPGDYLSRVASSYNSSVYAIQIANHMPNSSFIYVGQRLFIPGGVVPPNLPPDNGLYSADQQSPLIPPVLPPNGQLPFVYPLTATPLPPVFVQTVPTPIPPVVVVPPAPVYNSGSGVWEAILITSTVNSGPCWLGVYVDGKTDWPVVVATTDGGWISDPRYTGSKPERGPFYAEFANSCGGIWRVIPLGLNTYADVQLNGGHAEVEFRQRP